ncbi:hypothetical protein ASG35_07255 [Burkholderia sp. Leaf177]|uniref:hypothetical protein n=1 Tax=Burkholderia sp. Leaf177 TaxID=1736287 RepID=UPI0007011433|nr:hypothetical protein [Burkholderia sp. Leaf177]KQR79673.1 hypothetical protein ASG35_07255 [Burkholderia sp. Leaf177]
MKMELLTSGWRAGSLDRRRRINWKTGDFIGDGRLCVAKRCEDRNFDFRAKTSFEEKFLKIA